jgi:hypothetical protein
MTLYRLFYSRSPKNFIHSFISPSRRLCWLWTPLTEQDPLVRWRLLILEVTRPLSNTPHSVGLLWTGDQPDAETSTWQHNTHNRKTSMSPAGIEPAIPASERPKTLAFNRAATGTGNFREETFIMKHIHWEEICSEKKHVEWEETCTMRINMYSEKKYLVRRNM